MTIHGQSHPAQGVKLWMYYVERGAKKYAAEHATPGEWSKLFPKAARLEVAKLYEKHEREALQRGEYKKYPPVKKAASRDATLGGRHEHARYDPPRRVQILSSGGSSYFKPGSYGYAEAWSTHGGNHTLDSGVSRKGEKTYLVSKTKHGRGGALWFSGKGIRFTARGYR